MQKAEAFCVLLSGMMRQESLGDAARRAARRALSGEYIQAADADCPRGTEPHEARQSGASPEVRQTIPEGEPFCGGFRPARPAKCPRAHDAAARSAGARRSIALAKGRESGRAPGRSTQRQIHCDFLAAGRSGAPVRRLSSRRAPDAAAEPLLACEIDFHLRRFVLDGFTRHVDKRPLDDAGERERRLVVGHDRRA
jgi:hypothetical protein